MSPPPLALEVVAPSSARGESARADSEPEVAPMSAERSADSESARAPDAEAKGASPRLSPATLRSLAAVYLIWSSTYLALRFVVEELPPLLSGGFRYAIAGVILFVALRARGITGPSARGWILSIPIGALLFLCGNGFVALAEQNVPSGLAAIACAAMPLFLAVLGALSGERPSRREAAGLLVGFAGVVVLGAGDLRGAPASAALLMLAPMGWALGSFLAKKWPLPNGTMAAAVQMITGGAVSALVGVVRGETLPSHVPVRALLALLYLIVFGSIIAFTAYSHLLRTTRPSVATSYAYVNPMLAVGLGLLVGRERFGPTLPVAASLILVGVALVVSAKSKSK
jgi:drug/metabolite transporter (DMT)-like permease